MVRHDYFNMTVIVTAIIHGMAACGFFRGLLHFNAAAKRLYMKG